MAGSDQPVLANINDTLHCYVFGISIISLPFFDFRGAIILRSDESKRNGYVQDTPSLAMKHVARMKIHPKLFYILYSHCSSKILKEIGTRIDSEIEMILFKVRIPQPLSTEVIFCNTSTHHPRFLL